MLPRGEAGIRTDMNLEARCRKRSIHTFQKDLSPLSVVPRKVPGNTGWHCGRGALAPNFAPMQPPPLPAEGGPPTTAHPCGRGLQQRGQDKTSTTNSDIAFQKARFMSACMTT